MTKPRLKRGFAFGAGGENRTRDHCLEGSYFATKPRPLKGQAYTDSVPPQLEVRAPRTYILAFMRHALRSYLTAIGSIGTIGIIIALLADPSLGPPEIPVAETNQNQATSVSVANSPPSPENIRVLTPVKEQLKRSKGEQTAGASAPPLSHEEKGTGAVARIQNPYPFSPEPFSTVNERARAALVNILCLTDSGSMRPISGSGVIIDARGIILTNAHVAQYVLLAQSGEVRLSCTVRTGAPAHAVGTPEVLYLPPIWIQEHAKDIVIANPTGTGEHDYALLRLTSPVQSAPLQIDTREAISFQDDPVLAAGYPAEFIGGYGALHDLYPVSSITKVRELLTFESNTVDLISLSGIIEAQSGASGGPVVNGWGYLTGIITTTSDGVTTADRELHALTLSYIDRDLFAQSGVNLMTLLQQDADVQVATFKTDQAKTLTKQLTEQIAGRSQ